MVVDIVIQTQINAKENKLYPFRDRPFRPNFSVRGLTGKFYARHDAPDPNLIDPELEDLILKRQLLFTKDKYPEPLTPSMEYGWFVEPRILWPRFNFYFPKKNSWITEIGAVIAVEDQKMPKKLFNGVAFKV